MKRGKERDSSETAAIKINRSWACFIWKKAILDAIERKTMLALT